MCAEGDGVPCFPGLIVRKMSSDLFEKIAQRIFRKDLLASHRLTAQHFCVCKESHGELIQIAEAKTAKRSRAPLNIDIQIERLADRTPDSAGQQPAHA